MQSRAMLLALAVVGLASKTLAQDAPPNRLDLRAAYCLGSAQSFKANMEGMPEGNPAVETIQREAMEHNDLEIRRIQRYLLSRGILNSPDQNVVNSTLAAVAQAKDDLAQAVRDLSNPSDPYSECMRGCTAKHTPYLVCTSQCMPMEGEPQRHLATCKSLEADLPY